MDNNQFNQKNENQPEVIGELRKEKIGKPALVVEMIILFIAVMIALPIVYNMLNDENSALYKLVYGDKTNVVIPQGGEVTTPVQNEENILNGGERQALTKSNYLKLDGFVIGGFSLDGKTIECTMYAEGDSIDLTDEDYFLEVYSISSGDKALSHIKLDGKLDSSKINVTLKSSANHNSSTTYYGKVVKMSEYPSIELTSDESGLSSLTCTNNHREIDYSFYNYNLINITDSVRVAIKDMSEIEYLNYKNIYDNKASQLGPQMASITEDENGLLFKASMDMASVSFSTSIDENYFPNNTQASKVNYVLTGRGFDCK